MSELELTARGDDGVPTDCVVNFDNIHTIPRDVFRRPVVQLSPARMSEAGQRCATRPTAEGDPGSGCAEVAACRWQDRGSCRR